MMEVMVPFERISRSELLERAEVLGVWPSKLGSIYTNAATLIELLGDPGPGGSDHKTDVEWAAAAGSKLLMIWNWKDGVYLGLKFDIDEDREFSVWFSDPAVLEALERSIT